MEGSERRLVVATLNRAKAAEMLRLLADAPFAVELLADTPGATLPDETGESYRENALLKARAAARQTGAWALGDDSGLEVDALEGAPGIRSARFGGPDLADGDRIARLLHELRDVPDVRRRARFRSVVALVTPSGDEHVAEGVVDGTITRRPRGQAGFGYDPVFLYAPLGRTFAELTVEEKDRVSHRARAMRALDALWR